MSSEPIRQMVSMPSEWREELDKLKKEQFYDKPKSEMFRFLIGIGLQSVRSEPALIESELEAIGT